jgi:hypothetical protein
VEALGITLVSLAALASPAPANDASKEALSQFFTADGASFDFNAKRHALEVCWDLCQYYEMRNGPSAEAWDVVFLHQYYFVAPNFREEFRERYSSLAQALVAKHAHVCPELASEKAAPCILRNLGTRTGVEVAFVRYDEGYRCQVWGRLTDPKYQGKHKCTKVKHAS